MGEFLDSRAIANIDEATAYICALLNDAPGARISEILEVLGEG
jgi:hypothetical protein